jgi:hypothetical protein
VNRRVPLVLVGGFVLLVACSAPTTGRPIPTTSTPTQSSGPSASAGPDPLAKVDPCSLFTADQMAKNGMTSKKAQVLEGTRTCAFDRPIRNNDDGYSILVALREHEGYRSIYFGGDPESAHSVDGRPGVLVPRPEGISSSCQVAFEVTANSAVEVTVTPADDDVDLACTLASDGAGVVAGNLPAGV